MCLYPDQHKKGGKMQHVPLNNDAMRSATMITYDYDWKSIVLIVEKFASEVIAASNHKI